ncbi:hypothetical protein ANCCAN_17487 [Ancylostoma caninum]|uniref:Ubiquitin-like protease family profile domain-containing protein n=1 Tax=Ancylostoma caninum TaxID=29170 RepID=A0A368FWR7_ANCCA|nr:hypothetical protein ANCCAN_17487 [Ancylostoma caninum]
MTTCGCFLYDSAVSRLLEELWLGDEVIYAFLSLITSRSGAIAIDPLLIQTSASFTIPQYPIRDQICYVPLHMRRATHWGLGVFDTSTGNICVYDSYAHFYNYSPQLLQRDEPSIARMWRQITDAPLLRIDVAGRNSVHRQVDGFNCGMFACIYAERLLLGLPTNSEEPLPDFLFSARRHIHHCLISSFTVSERPSEHEAPLPRIFNYLSSPRYPLHLQFIDVLGGHSHQNPVSEMEIHSPFSTIPPLTSLADVPPPVPISSEPAVLPRGGVEHVSLPREQPLDEPSQLFQPLSNSPPLCLENSGVNDLPGIEVHSEEATLEEIVFFTQFSFQFSSDIAIVQALHTLSAPHSHSLSPNVHNSTPRSCSKLVVFYKNRLSRICAAIFRKCPKRSNAIVFDFSLTTLDGATRAYLQEIGACYGFRGSQLHIAKICRKRGDVYTNDLIVTSLCVLQYVTANDEAGLSLSPILIDRHQNSISTMLKSLPYSCFLKNVAHGAVLHMSEQLKAYDDVLFVNALVGYANHNSPSKTVNVSARRLVAVYSNECGDICGVFVQRYRKRCRGIVFDFSTRRLRSNTKAYLTSLSADCGFKNCYFNLSQCISDNHLNGIDKPVAVSLCILSTMNAENCDTVRLDSALLQQHRQAICQFLIGSCKDNTTGYTDIDDSSAPISSTATSTKIASTQRYVASNSSLTAVPVHLGSMSCICCHCNAVSFRGEAKSICCNGGINMVPENVCAGTKDSALNWFWERARADEKLFYMLRAVNNLVAFAGITMHLRAFDNVSGQIPLVVQGSVDVGICHMNPDTETASFAQLYICDDFKLRHSVKETTRQWKSKVEFTVIEKIISTLREINVIAQSYMSMYEVYLSALEEQSYSMDDIPPKILMNLKHRRDIPDDDSTHIHEGRLNVPKIDNQVAAIYVCRNGILPSHEELDRGVRVFCRGGRAIAAHHSNNIDALSYPLYFPRGEQSYVRDCLPKRSVKQIANKGRDEFFSDDDAERDDLDVSSKTLSRAEFYRFMLARRGCISQHRFLDTLCRIAASLLHIIPLSEKLSACERRMLYGCSSALLLPSHYLNGLCLLLQRMSILLQQIREVFKYNSNPNWFVSLLPLRIERSRFHRNYIEGFFVQCSFANVSLDNIFVYGDPTFATTSPIATQAAQLATQLLTAFCVFLGFHGLASTSLLAIAQPPVSHCTTACYHGLQYFLLPLRWHTFRMRPGGPKNPGSSVFSSCIFS